MDQILLSSYLWPSASLRLTLVAYSYSYRSWYGCLSSPAALLSLRTFLEESFLQIFQWPLKSKSWRTAARDRFFHDLKNSWWLFWLLVQAAIYKFHYRKVVDGKNWMKQRGNRGQGERERETDARPSLFTTPASCPTVCARDRMESRAPAGIVRTCRQVDRRWKAEKTDQGGQP